MHPMATAAVPCKRRRQIAQEPNPPPPPPPMTTINNLGDDLLVEILIRSFPNPKPASQSKLVCKRWRNLISDPTLFNLRFVSHHNTIINQGSPQEPPLFVTPSPSSSSSSSSSTFHQLYPSLSFLPVPDELGPEFTVWDSFKDLLLCGFSGSSRASSRDGLLMRSYFICNPFTKQWIALPLAPERPSRGVGGFVTRLACKPLSTTRVDLGDGQPPLTFSPEYRFRVLCMYQVPCTLRIDVFCSESGEWTKEANFRKGLITYIRPCNDGKLFSYCGFIYRRHDDDRYGVLRLEAFKSLQLRVMDPFRRLDDDDDDHEGRGRGRGRGRGYDLIDTCPLFPGGAKYQYSVSQDALHLVLLEAVEEKKQYEVIGGCWRNALSVWRLEEDDDDDDCKTWRKLHEVLLKETFVLSSSSSSSGCSSSTSASTSTTTTYELKRCFRFGVHPQKPEIVFLHHDDDSRDPSRGSESSYTILTCDLTGTGEVEFFGLYRRGRKWEAIQPRLSCWPTQIPRYEELQSGYDESYNYLAQSYNYLAQIEETDLRPHDWYYRAYE